MRDNCTPLYPTDKIGQRVSDYSLNHSQELPKELQEYHNHILDTEPRSNYMISALEAKYLLWFARSVGAKRGMSKASARALRH
jgi:hypothetical protein